LANAMRSYQRSLVRAALCGTLMACLWPCAAGATADAFRAIEDRLSRALAAHDTKTVAALWDDDFVFVWPDGKLAHKAERLAGVEVPPGSRPPGLTSQNDRVDVQYEDAHIAIVTVRSTWRFGANAPGDPYLATHVWIKRGDNWRLLSAQVAHVGH